MVISEFDVSLSRDLTYAVINLIEAEEHLKQTYAETKDEKYLEFLKAVRNLRGKYLEKLIKNKEFGTWCLSKHLLSAVMELGEVGSKLTDEDKKVEAKECYEDSQDLLKIFFLLHSEEFQKKKKTLGAKLLPTKIVK